MSAEGILVGAVDGGIMLNALQTAAESFGYGTTAIGGIRRNPDKMIELLELPEGTFPLVGTTIGVRTEEKPSFVKPRVPLNSFAHTEKYDKNATEKGVDDYDLVLRKWWDDLGMTQMGNYSQDVSNYYQTIYFPTVAANLRKQGFEFQDELK
jgi:FMN reductase [NAD(P)H]